MDEREGGIATDRVLDQLDGAVLGVGEGTGRGLAGLDRDAGDVLAVDGAGGVAVLQLARRAGEDPALREGALADGVGGAWGERVGRVHGGASDGRQARGEPGDLVAEREGGIATDRVLDQLDGAVLGVVEGTGRGLAGLDRDAGDVLAVDGAGGVATLQLARRAGEDPALREGALTDGVGGARGERVGRVHGGASDGRQARGEPGDLVAEREGGIATDRVLDQLDGALLVVAELTGCGLVGRDRHVLAQTRARVRVEPVVLQGLADLVGAGRVVREVNRALSASVAAGQ